MLSVAQMRPPRHGTKSLHASRPRARVNLTVNHDEADLDEAEELITKGELRKPEDDAHTRPLVPWLLNDSSESSDMILRRPRPETQGTDNIAHPVRSPSISHSPLPLRLLAQPLRVSDFTYETFLITSGPCCF